ncbi:MAG: glycoside hydrolase family 30 beta sandwich domain-containing protein [Acholeplasma sp.]|nr:glycoside hydrolase family 30 beta sandwich domain-containing protein [Acholeplasma sp.]
MKITPYVTTHDETLLLKRMKDLEVSLEDSRCLNKITVNSKIVYQEIDGFGAAMTESSAYLISKLSKSKQEEVFKDLFTNEGINISLVRTTIGASDFSLNNYSYNDIDVNEEDLELTKFSIDRDLDYVVPVLQNVKRYQNIKIISSPWSAPAWMKESKTLNGGRMDSKYLNVYSRYLSKFIKEYKKRDLDVYAITVQNEPLHEVNSYPTMYMEANQQKELIKEIGNEFSKENIETKIIAYDHNWDDVKYSQEIYQDEVANKYVAGSAFHCYNGDVKNTAILNNQFPNKDLWFTECSGGSWAPKFGDNLVWNTENVFIGSIRNRAKSVLLWNLALDETCGPKNGGCQNCRGVLTIDLEEEKISKNVEYYVIGHFSKFVLPNARYIESISNNENLVTTAFINPDNSKVIIVLNKGDNDQNVTIKLDGKGFEYKAFKKSVVSLIIK